MRASRHSRKSGSSCQPDDFKAIASGGGLQIRPYERIKMEAFVVFTREETTDPEELATYSAGVGPSFDGHDVTFLAAYGAMEHLEGPPVEGAVILRFPTI